MDIGIIEANIKYYKNIGSGDGYCIALSELVEGDRPCRGEEIRVTCFNCRWHIMSNRCNIVRRYK